MKLKIYSIPFVAIMIVLFACSKSKNKDTIKKDNTVALGAQSERDFKKIDSLKGYFCDYPEECQRYENGTFLEQRRFEDKVSKNRMRLALDFLESYPDDPRYYKVLKFFFNLNFEPLFVTDKISDSLRSLLTKDNGNGVTPMYLHQQRALPIDKQARDEWLKKGHELAEKVLKSDAPLENKVDIEIALLARDFRMALLQYEHLDKQKEGVEAGFWEQFDFHYWEPFRLRTYHLLERYADLEIMGSYVQQFISLISGFSPKIIEPYWTSFLNLTDKNSPYSDKKAFRVVQKMAIENLAALKKIDDTKPLNMAFTALDGTKIDLADMRGKVVLIDFWNTRCAPCIKEMPFVQTMYDKYKSQGFEVIGLAANGDESKEQVLKILKKTGATWPQRLDKGTDATVSYHGLYKINSLPTVWLLDKEGKIVDKDARGMRLEPLIHKYLSLDK